MTNEHKQDVINLELIIIYVNVQDNKCYEEGVLCFLNHSSFE